MFSTLPKTNFNFSVAFNLSSANAFNLDQSKILLCGKELRLEKHSIILNKIENATLFLLVEMAKKLFLLAPLAKGQQAIVMALCWSFVCPFVPPSVRP